MIEFLFGDRAVGTLSLEGGTGIGARMFQGGVVSLDDMRVYTIADGQAFLDAVLRQFNGRYFKAHQAGQ